MTLITAGILVLSLVALGVGLADGAPQEGPPVPGPEHEALKPHVGVWDAEVEAFGQKSKGVETVTAGGGGFFIVSDFKGELMGGPYHGHGVTGFDPTQKKFVSVWADSSGSVTTMDGPAGSDPKVMIQHSEGPDPMTGKIVRWKHVSRFTGDDRRTYTISAVGAKPEDPPFLHISYVRRK